MDDHVRERPHIGTLSEHSQDAATGELAMFLRVPQAAALLSISRASAYQYVRQGLIPSVRIAGQLRIPRAALLKFERDAMEQKTTLI